MLGRRSLRNIELAHEAKKNYPAFTDVSEDALLKDISRFVGRELGKTIKRDDGGRLVLIPGAGDQPLKKVHELFQIQVDIRARESRRSIHVFRLEEMRSLSEELITEFNPSIFSRIPQDWKQRNLVIEMKQGDAMRRYDSENLPRFREHSGPSEIQPILDLPRPLAKNQRIRVTFSFDDADLDPDYLLVDCPPSQVVMFDVIKGKTDNESLYCVVRERRSENGVYLPEVGEGQLVTNLVTGEELYALRLSLKNPKPWRDYYFRYQD